MTKVFIDGQEGTTGLKIYDYLKSREDINLLIIDDNKRKDIDARRKYLNSADIVFLCLPDIAAIEAVSLIDNPDTAIIDASTAHRTMDNWAYGFPELDKMYKDNIIKLRKVAVPGCHASGFNAIVYPLVKYGIINADYPIVCHSLTGYSGGGKSMIKEYEGENRSIELDSPRLYALEQKHKHLREIKKHSGLAYEPLFNPIVADFYSGMEVSIPLYTRLFNKTMDIAALQELYTEHYKFHMLINVERAENTTFLAANSMSNSNKLKIIISGNADRVNINALYDNLGKGASGAAVQCMNILMGKEDSYKLI